jgi:hypothetical protein
MVPGYNNIINTSNKKAFIMNLTYRLRYIINAFIKKIPSLHAYRGWAVLMSSFICKISNINTVKRARRHSYKDLFYKF